MEKPIIGPEETYRMVGRTTSLEEANRLAEHYEMQGFKTQIIKKKQGEITFYEIWIAKKPEIFQMERREPNAEHKTLD